MVDKPKRSKGAPRELTERQNHPAETGSFHGAILSLRKRHLADPTPNNWREPRPRERAQPCGGGGSSRP
eukprot:4135991-Alexandrium_andersonii.AAC.1